MPKANPIRPSSATVSAACSSGEGLRAANVDPDGEEARTARQQLDRLLGAFESVEGKPPTMADIRGLVGDLAGDVLPRAEGDPNIVRTSGGEPVEANGNTEIAPLQEPVEAPRRLRRQRS